MEGYLRHWQEMCSSLQQMEQVLWKYADSVLMLYRPLYKEYVFEEMSEVLPKEAQLALKLKKLQQHREQGDDRKAIECLRKCVGLYPVLEEFLEAYATMYRDTLQMQNQYLSAEKKEFIQLVNSLKSIAKQRLERKEYQEAREILLQIQQCVPEEKEVEELLIEADNGFKIENSERNIEGDGSNNENVI